MVIRQGFVSNSSSSSFVIFYRDATIDEIDDEHIMVVGEWLSEGKDVFTPDEQTKAYLKVHPEFFEDYIRPIYVYKKIEEDGILNPKELGDQPVKVEAINVDYHISYDWESFSYNYLEKNNGW
jgi:hypothetical protein